jgi:NAD(P)-dependent dehydrogenase (short-subunit alcohol dehydrogenase family)
MNTIITGAGRGIGYEVARDLAGKGGNKIIAVSRNLHVWLENPHPDVIPLPLDLEKPDASKTLYEFARNTFGYVDILINNAGYLVNKSIADSSEDDFDRQFNVNVRSVFLNIKALLPLLRKGSHVVNISSMGGFQGSLKFPGLSLYSASKAALASLTECLATELSETGISFNCLALGAARTEMLASAFPGYKAPLSASEMAVFISYFALNGQKYFNGKIIPVALSTP